VVGYFRKHLLRRVRHGQQPAAFQGNPFAGVFASIFSQPNSLFFHLIVDGARFRRGVSNIPGLPGFEKDVHRQLSQPYHRGALVVTASGLEKDVHRQ
jgi:hypothetical protein